MSRFRLGRCDEPRFEHDEEHDWTLHFATESGHDMSATFHTNDAVTLWQALDATIGDHVREGQRERAAYDRATPEERARVISGTPVPDADDDVRAAGDGARKAAREHRG